MKWMLVVIVMNAPVKTDLVFGSLAECLLGVGDRPRFRQFESLLAQYNRGLTPYFR